MAGSNLVPPPREIVKAAVPLKWTVRMVAALPLELRVPTLIHAARPAEALPHGRNSLPHPKQEEQDVVHWAAGLATVWVAVLARSVAPGAAEAAGLELVRWRPQLAWTVSQVLAKERQERLLE